MTMNSTVIMKIQTDKKPLSFTILKVLCQE